MGKNVTVSDGYLRLKAIKESNPGGSSYPYTSGYVITGKVKPGGWFTYGFFEARLKCPQMNGAWCAFWLWEDPNGSDEIDITETLGNDNMTHNMNLHGATTWSRSYRMATPNYEWHVYAIDWQPGYIRWYVDNVLTGTYTGTAFNGSSMYLIFNYQLGGSWAGAVDESKLPNEMLIDFVHVFEVKP